MTWWLTFLCFALMWCGFAIGTVLVLADQIPLAALSMITPFVFTIVCLYRWSDAETKAADK